MSGELLTDATLAVLRAIQESGEITTRSLNAQGLDAKNAVDSLRRCGYIECAGRTESGNALYRTTYQGDRRLKVHGGSGVIAAPRMPVSADTYKGERWNVRDTGRQALDLLSRRGDAYVPHERMFSLASRVQDTKFR